MGVRFVSEHVSIDGIIYGVHILDAQGGGSTLFRFGGAGLNIEWGGIADDMLPGIRTAHVSFDMIAENGTANPSYNNEYEIEQFANDLLSSSGRRFFVRVFRDLKEWFVGPISIEGVFLENITPPYGVTITANDGMADMRDVEYKMPNGDPFESGPDAPNGGWQTVIEHIANIIALHPAYDIFDGNVFVTSPAFWEANHSSTSVDPFRFTRFNHGVFTKKDKDGHYTYSTVWYVLEQICFAFDLKWSVGIGWYHAEVISNRANNYITEFVYDRDGTFKAAVTTPGQTIQINREKVHLLHGSGWTGASPYREVRISYGFETENNLLKDIVLNKTTQAQIFLGTYLVENQESHFSFSGQLQYQVKATYSPYFPTNYVIRGFPRWKLTITIYNNNTGVTHRWIKINNNKVDGWSSTPDGDWTFTLGVEIPTEPGGPPFVESKIFTYNINESSAPIDVAYASANVGDVLNVYLQLEFLSYKDRNGGDITDTYIDYWLENGAFEVVDGKQNTVVQNSFEYLKENSTDNNLSVKLDVVIGDGPGGGIGRLQTSPNGSTWSDSADWGIRALGGGGPVLGLTVTTIAARTDTAIKILTGTGALISGSSSHFNSRSKITYRGETYLLLSGTMNSEMGETTFKAYKIDALSLPSMLIMAREIRALTLSSGAEETTIRGPVLRPGGDGDTYVEDQPRGVVYLDQTIEAGDEYCPTDPIAITVADYRVFNAGDRITIIDPVSGAEEEVTIAKDTKAGDTAIYIECHTFENTLYVGAAVRLIEDFEVNYTYSETRELYMLFTGVTGNYLDLTAHPDYEVGLLTLVLANASNDQIYKRLWVEKRGVHLYWYQGGPGTVPDLTGSDTYGYYIDAANDRLKLLWPADDDVYLVRIQKIENRA